MSNDQQEATQIKALRLAVRTERQDGTVAILATSVIDGKQLLCDLKEGPEDIRATRWRERRDWLMNQLLTLVPVATTPPIVALGVGWLCTREGAHEIMWTGSASAKKAGLTAMDWEQGLRRHAHGALAELQELAQFLP